MEERLSCSVLFLQYSEPRKAFMPLSFPCLDFLLCHDDKVEDRQVAFIYYLVPEDWTHGDGGRLDLFNNKGK